MVVIPRLIDPDEALAKRLKAFAGTILWQRDGFRPDPPLMKRLARCRILDSSGPWDFAAQVHRAIRGKSLTGPVDPRYLLCRRFRELNYYLLADLPDGNGRPEEGEIRLENSRIRYRFDEDHLGVLLMRRGKLMGLAGFKQLWVNGEKILDCPGYFYARSRDGRPLGQTASPVTASFLPGAHRLKVNGSFRLF